MKNLFEKLQQESPLVHNITNYVTVNDCANIILAAGGSPVMADDAGEVSDIVSISKALYLNVGTLNQRTIESMIIAGKKANEMGIPVVLDPVGMGASGLRNQTVNELLQAIHFSAIKGNMSEIRSIYENARTTSGVDAEEKDQINASNLSDAVELAKRLARRFDAVVIVTGAVDIITDGQETCTVSNGHPMMSKITGTGCMTGSLIASFSAISRDDVYSAASLAVSLMGLAGERAHALMEERGEGTSSMKRYLIDQMIHIDYENWKAGMKIENYSE